MEYFIFKTRYFILLHNMFSVANWDRVHLSLNNVQTYKFHANFIIGTRRLSNKVANRQVQLSQVQHWYINSILTGLRSNIDMSMKTS